MYIYISVYVTYITYIYIILWLDSNNVHVILILVARQLGWNRLGVSETKEPQGEILLQLSKLPKN